MSAYVLRRLALLPILLLGITMINFAVFTLSPGDPIISMVDPTEMTSLTPEQVEARREALGLNQPIPVRYVLWLKETLTGNLGHSIQQTIPVSQVLRAGIGNTLLLLLMVMVIETIGGVALGFIAALKPYTKLDYVLTTLAFAGASIPGFFLGLILIYLGALRLGWLPTGGISTVGQSSITDRLEHMILPAIALSVDGFGGIMRYTRSALLEVFKQDFITTARAKGLRERTVILGHAFRNASLPLITVTGLRLPTLLGGAVLIETVFNYPGIGLAMVRATTMRDYPVLMGGVLFSAAAVLLASLIADLAYAWADPRIRYS